MTEIVARHACGDRVEIASRGHVVVVDQPEPDGGTDRGPTPTELFVAGLCSCVAFYARRYLARHHLPEAGLAVTARATMAYAPARVRAIDVVITVPPGVPAERRRALLKVASHCTVHNSLIDPPAVTVDLSPALS